ncbi:WXG100 family type VII secretion target [Kitasatospora sp. NPDC092948]|uniref:WXG100 family type VII secretion target n=1 Tax=Kitasatospora sp. NPDC092948 TaxID=3364088 RepID=UPI0037F85C2B
MASRKSSFDHYALIPLKDMVGHSSPQQIRDVGEHWKSVHQELTQVAADLQQAVQHATTHWEGAASQGFAQKGGQIQQSLTNTAAHAQNTSVAMDYAATALQQTKSTMSQIKVPSFMDRVGKTLNDGFASSDEGFKRDLASGMNRIDAVNKNAHDLSATEVAHQYAIGVMEHLGPQYAEAASYLESPPKKDYDGGLEAYPPPPQASPPPNQIPPSSPMPKYPEGHPKDLPSTPPGYTPPQGPGQQTPWSPGQVDPTPPSHTLPPINPGQQWNPPSTGLDGWTPPESGGGLPGGPNGGLPGGVGTLPGPGGGGGGAGGGGGFGGGGGYVPGAGGGGYLPGGGGSGGGRTGGLGTGGLGGGGSAGKVGGAGGVGGAGKAGGAGAAGAGGAGAAGGRGAAGAGGAGGMHGGGMGGAGGAKGGAGGKSGSGLVRKAGGTIGGAKAGGAGGRAFTEGGSGIGKGRGAGQGGANGMHGAPGSGSANRKKKAEGHRPDYLIEDEETWRGGTANPPVIE